jgi:hypothetical protein
MNGHSLAQLIGRGLARTQGTLGRAASVAAVAGLLVAALPGNAGAQGIVPRGGLVGPLPTLVATDPPPPPPNFSINFTHPYCVDESSEIGSDEPYVVFAVISFTNLETRIFRTTVFGSVDTNEHRFQTVNLWNARPLPGGSIDNLIVLAQVMEHDDSNPDNLINMGGLLQNKAIAYKQSGFPRDTVAAKLKDDMHELAEQFSVFLLGGPFDLGKTLDDRVARPQEVRFTQTDVNSAAAGTPATKMVYSDGGGDGQYRHFYELIRS